MFKGRSVIEIMVLFFTFVVGFAILAIGATISIVEIRDPDTDTDGAVETLFTAITIVLGALLGLLASKSAAVTDLSRRPEELEPKDITERIE